MTNARKRIVGLAGLGLVFGLLMYAGALGFLAGQDVLTQHCDMRGASAWVSNLRSFVWFQLDIGVLAIHVAVVATLVVASRYLRHGKLPLAITQGVGAALSVQLLIFAALWAAYLHRAELEYANGDLNPVSVVFAGAVTCVAGALVLCVLYGSYRFGLGWWLLLWVPLVVLAGVWWVGRGGGWYWGIELPNLLRYRRESLFWLPVVSLVGSLVLRSVWTRSGRSELSETANWMAGIAAMTLAQLGFALILLPFMFSVTSDVPYPWSHGNLLIHAVFIPIELVLVWLIWRRRGGFVLTEESRHGFPVA
jgi:hypothetical protein